MDAWLIGPDASGLWVETEGAVIRAAGTDRPSMRTELRRLQCADARIEAGRVNAHTHLYSGLGGLGMPVPSEPPPTFIDVLAQVWWRLDRALDHETLRAAARDYVARALLAGTTALIDHHESPECIEGSLDILAEACDELGMRAVLCYGATERNGGADEAKAGLEECRRFFETNRRPLVRGVVGLHASFTVSDDTVAAAADLCRELGTVLHLHLAEDFADVEDARRRGYAGPLERLIELGALPSGSILAHGVHLGADQVRRASSAGCWIVQNPRSNRGNRVGYPLHLRHAEHVALGTDGYPADMGAEAEALTEEARRHVEELGPAAAAEIRDLDRRMRGGIGLIGVLFGAVLRPLSPGAAADLVVTDDRIRHVLVGGRLVVENGKLRSGNVEAVRREAERAAPGLWERMRTL